MPSAAHKKVVVSRFERESLKGFVQTPGSFTADLLELLTPTGALVRVPYSEIKAVSFVRDFEGGETWKDHRSFATRPKTPGLWVRLVFRDGDTTEGLVANDLAALERDGFQVTPPDPSFQNQRMFVPREALKEAQVLGVIGSPLRRKRAKLETKPSDQIELF